ncbi:MAG TPA: DUF559 domain-containing protein [Thermoanaerobaculia bacterium]|nr:DUF559 domain-containing protein [Thermoanaerobaculia bacterium]
MPKGIFQGSTEAHAQARELRKSTTVAENALWDLLRHRHLGGLKFRRQFPIGRFITDFCCYSLRLIVELDGAVHELPAQAAHDKNRDAYLRWRGYTVLRISNHRLVDDPEGVLEEIQAAARQRGWVPGPHPPTPSPIALPPPGRGGATTRPLPSSFPRDLGGAQGAPSHLYHSFPERERQISRPPPLPVGGSAMGEGDGG